MQRFDFYLMKKICSRPFQSSCSIQLQSRSLKLVGLLYQTKNSFIPVVIRLHKSGKGSIIKDSSFTGVGGYNKLQYYVEPFLHIYRICRDILFCMGAATLIYFWYLN